MRVINSQVNKKQQQHRNSLCESSEALAARACPCNKWWCCVLRLPHGITSFHPQNHLETQALGVTVPIVQMGARGWGPGHFPDMAVCQRSELDPLPGAAEPWLCPSHGTTWASPPFPQALGRVGVVSSGLQLPFQHLLSSFQANGDVHLSCFLQLQVWSWDQEHHPGGSQLENPCPDPLSQNLHFNKMSLSHSWAHCSWKQSPLHLSLPSTGKDANPIHRKSPPPGCWGHRCSFQP